MNKQNLTIAIPAKTHVNTRFTMALMHSVGQLNKYFNVLVDFLPGKSNIVHARSIMLTKWFNHSKSDNDLFLFIDSDHIFTANDILKLYFEKDSDVTCGIYCNSAGGRNVYPMFPKKFHKDRRILYAGTGFMLIKKNICKKVAKLVFELDKTTYVNIDTGNQYVIPFFRTRFVNSEINTIQTEKDWLGEDYSFCWLVRQVGGIIKGIPVERMGHEVTKTVYYKDHPNYIKEQQKIMNENNKEVVDTRNTLSVQSKRFQSQRKITYFCGNSWVKFSPISKALGGSEKAVVNLCREFALLGYTVEVYGNVEPGLYNNVIYKQHNEFNPNEVFDVLILWRGFGFSVLKYINHANTILLDFHDVSNLSEYPPNYFNKAAYFMMKSEYHTTLFPSLDKSKMIVCKNGLEEVFKSTNLSQYQDIKREPLKFCYTSCYTRCLDVILTTIWPKILKEFPDAQLNLFYGMDLVDPTLKSRLNELIKSTPNVKDCGRIPIEELNKVKFESTYHLYITNFGEIDCLSVRESAVCGCIPIITNQNVFKERKGYHIEGDPTNIEFYKNASNEIIQLMKNKKKIKKLSTKLKKSNEQFWNDTAKQWEKLFKTA